MVGRFVRLRQTHTRNSDPSESNVRKISDTTVLGHDFFAVFQSLYVANFPHFLSRTDMERDGNGDGSENHIETKNTTEKLRTAVLQEAYRWHCRLRESY